MISSRFNGSGVSAAVSSSAALPPQPPIWASAQNPAVRRQNLIHDPNFNPSANPNSNLDTQILKTDPNIVKQNWVDLNARLPPTKYSSASIPANAVASHQPSSNLLNDPIYLRHHFESLPIAPGLSSQPFNPSWTLLTNLMRLSFLMKAFLIILICGWIVLFLLYSWRLSIFVPIFLIPSVFFYYYYRHHWNHAEFDFSTRLYAFGFIPASAAALVIESGFTLLFYFACFNISFDDVVQAFDLVKHQSRPWSYYTDVDTTSAEFYGFLVAQATVTTALVEILLFYFIMVHVKFYRRHQLKNTRTLNVYSMAGPIAMLTVQEIGYLLVFGSDDGDILNYVLIALYRTAVYIPLAAGLGFLIGLGCIRKWLFKEKMSWIGICFLPWLIYSIFQLATSIILTRTNYFSSTATQYVAYALVSAGLIAILWGINWSILRWCRQMEDYVRVMIEENQYQREQKIKAEEMRKAELERKEKEEIVSKNQAAAIGGGVGGLPDGGKAPSPSSNPVARPAHVSSNSSGFSNHLQDQSSLVGTAGLGPSRSSTSSTTLPDGSTVYAGDWTKHSTANSSRASSRSPSPGPANRTVATSSGLVAATYALPANPNAADHSTGLNIDQHSALYAPPLVTPQVYRPSTGGINQNGLYHPTSVRSAGAASGSPSTPHSPPMSSDLASPNSAEVAVPSHHLYLSAAGPAPGVAPHSAPGPFNRGFLSQTMPPSSFPPAPLSTSACNRRSSTGYVIRDDYAKPPVHPRASVSTPATSPGAIMSPLPQSQQQQWRDSQRPATSPGDSPMTAPGGVTTGSTAAVSTPPPPPLPLPPISSSAYRSSPRRTWPPLPPRPVRANATRQHPSSMDPESGSATEVEREASEMECKYEVEGGRSGETVEPSVSYPPSFRQGEPSRSLADRPISMLPAETGSSYYFTDETDGEGRFTPGPGATGTGETPAATGNGEGRGAWREVQWPRGRAPEEI